MSDDGPKKKYCLKLFVDGHDWEGVLRNLEEFFYHVKEHGELCSLVSGGRGYIDIQINPEQTKEKYDAELDVWFQKHCDERDAKAKAEEHSQERKNTT